jgi:hypothetical protein
VPCGICISKETINDMARDVWYRDERALVGDIQDQMIDGNASRENLS